MEWIRVKNKLPPMKDHIEDRDNPVLAYHTVHGVGFGLFFIWPNDELYLIEEEYKKFNCKYLYSAEFIFSSFDGNYCPQSEDDIDIFDDSPHFRNLGTISHWAEFPKPPLLTPQETYICNC